jgi:hypothetical protein
MLNKFLCVIMLGAIVGLSSAGAQSAAAAAPTAPSRVRGRIIVAKVDGHVTVLTKATGVSVAAKSGDTILDGTQVVTAPGAEAILVFSNGASVDVAADSTLDIDEFQQDPFATEQKVSEMTQEPTTSVTKLSLTKGELVGKVVHLNIDRGSEFTVQTPVGAAGIRGTTFEIVFRPDPNNPGHALFTVYTVEGNVTVEVGHGSAPVSVPAGKQVAATFNYTPPSSTGTGAGAGTGTGTGTVSPITVVTSDTSASDTAAIQNTTLSIVTANQGVFIAASNASTAAGTPATATPNPPSNTPPATPDTSPVLTPGS